MFEKFKEEYQRRMAETEGMTDAEKKAYAKDLIGKQKVFRIAKRIYKIELWLGLAMFAVLILYAIFGR